MLSARAPSVSCNERWAQCFAQRRGPFLPVLGVSFIRVFPRSHRGILTKPIAASSASMVLSRTRIPCARLLTEIWFAFLEEIELRHYLTFPVLDIDRKSTRLNSSHLVISYSVFCLKKNK